MDGPACRYDVERLIYDGEQPKTVSTDRSYVARHSRKVAEQLQRAGIRFAGILNSIFAVP
jgi:hypothetical protein